MVQDLGNKGTLAMDLLSVPTSRSHWAFEDTDVLSSVDLLQHLQFILGQSEP